MACVVHAILHDEPVSFPIGPKKPRDAKEQGWIERLSGCSPFECEALSYTKRTPDIDWALSARYHTLLASRSTIWGWQEELYHLWPMSESSQPFRKEWANQIKIKQKSNQIQTEPFRKECQTEPSNQNQTKISLRRVQALVTLGNNVRQYGNMGVPTKLWRSRWFPGGRSNLNKNWNQTTNEEKNLENPKLSNVC